MISGVNKRHISLITGLVLFTSLIDAQIQLEYRHKTGDKWHLTSEVQEDVFLDDELLFQSKILNKISAEVLKDANNDGYLRNRYQIAESPLDQEMYIWNKEYEVSYGRDSRGRISGLDRNSPVPPMRNVPVYPDKPVIKGEKWQEPGQECFDLEPTFMIKTIIKINFFANYEYLGPETLDDREMEKIKIYYQYNWEPDVLTLREFQKYAVYPDHIAGKFEQYVYWDPAVGKNYAAEGSFIYDYRMNDDHVYTFKGKTVGNAVYSIPMDKDRVIEEFKATKKDDISIKTTSQGISVTLENIHFFPDRAEMLPGEEKKLENIVNILKKLHDRDILVIGHTANVAGSGDGKELSEKRAQTIAQYLFDTGNHKKTQIISRGMGNTQPIADNSTEKGRKKNRRVEIIILEN